MRRALKWPAAVLGLVLIGVLYVAVTSPFSPIAEWLPAPASDLDARLRLLDAFDPTFACEPYSGMDRAAVQWAASATPANETVQAIERRLGLPRQPADWSPSEIRQAFDVLWRLRAMVIQRRLGRYEFSLTTERYELQGPPRKIAEVFVQYWRRYGRPMQLSSLRARRVHGVEGHFEGGRIIVTNPDGPVNCPTCLAQGTRIAAPGGDIAVQDITPGTIVWTRDASGARVAAPVVRTARVPVTAYSVVRVVLSDGRTLSASAPHPTADGRTLGDLRPGDTLDGATILRADLVPYAGPATYDLLPAGATGDYWADGVLLGSTLGP